MKGRIMERKEGWIKAECSKILWAVTVILLCVPPMVWAYVEFPEGTYTVNSTIIGEVWVLPGASVTMEGDAHIADDPAEEGNMYVAGIVVIHAGIVDGFIDTLYGTGTVTVYGTDFAEEDFPNPPVPIGYGAWTPSGGSGTLKGTYENGTPISLLFNSDTPIILVDTGGAPPENTPPVADAGPDVTVSTLDVASTIIDGTATDEDVSDSLQYRWIEELEGDVVEFTLWIPVGENGEAPLDLDTILPSYLGVGTHTLTLEVTDGKETVSDDMVLEILAIPPEITEITIEPTPLGSPTTVTATFTDADGGTHTAAIVWEEGGTPESGVVNETEMSVTGTHTYPTTGVYTVTVTVTDQNGGEATSTAYAAVYDPDAFSFVTGAGWIADEGSTCGKAFLGFFVRQWGNTPYGWMRFRWGSNRFRATEFDYLVVSEDKSSAWFAGVGTINGAGEHYFMVEIYDQPDSIWITIFDEYDTGSLVDLVRGQIRIRQWGG